MKFGWVLLMAKSTGVIGIGVGDVQHAFRISQKLLKSGPNHQSLDDLRSQECWPVLQLGLAHCLPT